MKLAAPFPLREERREKIDEYNIEFKVGENQEKNLIEWIQKPQAQEKRINLTITPNDGMRKFNLNTLALLNNSHPNFYLRLSTFHEELIAFCQQNKIHFFFDSTYSANSFCQLVDFIRLGVSDVYISEDVCYNLKQAKRLCKDNNIQLRFIANVISSTALTKGTDPTAPWYVPENMPALEQFYDVIEFDLRNSWNRFDVLYKIWIKNQEWKANIADLNFELNIDIAGEFFISDLCIYKMQCEHRCITKGNTCNKCQQYIEVAQILDAKTKTWAEDDKDELIENIFK